MEKKQFLEAVTKVRTATQKRNFVQSFDIIINLKDVDLKKENERILTFLRMPFSRGKKIAVTALVGKELATKAKEVCNTVIQKEQFPTAEKKFIKQLAAKTDFFIAQANVMPDIAKTFGRILGTRGLMPNPKAGCVLAPTDEVKPLIERLQHTVRLETKNEPTIKTIIGAENMKDEEVAENALAVYNVIIHSLPQENQNVKSVLLKLTMGKPVAVGIKEEVQEKETQKQVQTPQEKKQGEQKQKTPVPAEKAKKPESPKKEAPQKEKKETKKKK